jgi:hypothetical protein
MAGTVPAAIREIVRRRSIIKSSLIVASSRKSKVAGPINVAQPRSDERAAFE